VLTPKIISGEVLVSSANMKEVGQGNFKPAKEYGRVRAEKKETKNERNDKVFVPQPRQGLSLKV